MAQRTGICCAGNMIVDTTYPITAYPKENELVHITDGISSSTGGAVCNTILDLARLNPTLPLIASGFAGHDSEGDFMLAQLRQHPNIDLSMVKREGRTSFTAVMSNNETKNRTFFQHSGSNAVYNQDDINWDSLTSYKLLHIGYILLLPALDQPDPDFGTKMAKLLHHAQSVGLKTSVDVVSESGSRFKRLVTPSLKYTDYCIINELEAQQTTGICLRDEAGVLHPENMKAALQHLFDLGISTWAVIHCPEAGYGLDQDGNFFVQPSLHLPKGYIQGTVGAGDAFCSGILYGAHNGDSLQDALRLAVCSAAASLSAPGASDGLQPVEQILSLYTTYPPKGV